MFSEATLGTLFFLRNLDFKGSSNQLLPDWLSDIYEKIRLFENAARWSYRV